MTPIEREAMRLLRATLAELVTPARLRSGRYTPQNCRPRSELGFDVCPPGMRAAAAVVPVTLELASEVTNPRLAARAEQLAVYGRLCPEWRN